MKITRRQLRRIICEAIDVMNASTGEVMVFADEGDPDAQGYKPDAPELAARDTIKRLGLTPLKGYSDGAGDPGVEEIWLGAEDYATMDAEIGGKRHKRKARKELDRLNIDNLMSRLKDWALQAGQEYLADNQEFPETRLEDIAWDMSDGVQFSFEPDEYQELLANFDFDEDVLRNYVADMIASE